MKSPDLVSDICKQIADNTGITPSIKCRIGLDDNGFNLGGDLVSKSKQNMRDNHENQDKIDDEYKYFTDFVHQVSTKGNVTDFIIHARKAIINSNFSPNDNRSIPPLKYQYVYQLIRDFPHLNIALNGGVRTYEDILLHRQNGVKEVMIGRGVIDDPFYYRHNDFIMNNENWDMNDIHQLSNPLTRRQILMNYCDYVQQFEKESYNQRNILLAPVYNIFHGKPNGKLFRRILTESMVNKDTLPSHAILTAMQVISDETLDQTDS